MKELAPKNSYKSGQELLKIGASFTNECLLKNLVLRLLLALNSSCKSA